MTLWIYSARVSVCPKVCLFTVIKRLSHPLFDTHATHLHISERFPLTSFVTTCLRFIIVCISVEFIVCYLRIWDLILAVHSSSYVAHVELILRGKNSVMCFLFGIGGSFYVPNISSSIFPSLIWWDPEQMHFDKNRASNTLSWHCLGAWYEKYFVRWLGWYHYVLDIDCNVEENQEEGGIREVGRNLVRMTAK